MSGEMKILAFGGVFCIGYIFAMITSSISSPTKQEVKTAEVPVVTHIQKSIDSKPVEYKNIPNKNFESQLPEDMRNNYRVANIIPGEDIWIAERIPEKYWLLLYDVKNNNWVVTEQSYGVLPELPKDNTKIDRDTAQIQ